MSTAILLPESGAEPDALDAASLLRFEESLLRIARTVFRPAAVPGTPVDKAGYVTLSRLGRCGASRLSDLAAQLELDLSTVSRQVKILEASGLVARTSDPDDRRAAVVDLTAAGRTELDRQREHRFLTLTAALGQMPVRDRTRLVSLLDQLAGSLSPEGVCAKTTGRPTR